MNDSVGLYLNDIGKVPLLTAEDERELSRNVQNGLEAQAKVELLSKIGHISTADLKEGKAFINEYENAELPSDDAIARDNSPYLQQMKEIIDVRKNASRYKAEMSYGLEAKDRFIRSNLRLVVSIARRYPLPQGMELLDLIQEGNLGLEHAVDKFDWQRGFKFSTYATFWIRQAIGRSLDQKASLIRVPGERSTSLRAALRQATKDGGQLNSFDDETQKLTTVISLDKKVGDGGDATLGDLMASGEPTPEDEIMQLVDIELLGELLDRLDTRARYAVERRFGLADGEGNSFREIGQELGVTAEATRRLVSRAVTILRDEAKKY